MSPRQAKSRVVNSDRGVRATDVISVTPVRVWVWNSCTCRVNPGHIGDAACTEPDSKECLQLSEGTRYRRILIQQWPPRHQASNGVLSALAPICLSFPECVAVVPAGKAVIRGGHLAAPSVSGRENTRRDGFSARAAALAIAVRRTLIFYSVLLNFSHGSRPRIVPFQPSQSLFQGSRGALEFESE